MAFKPAKRTQAKFKMALTGPSGSGKTYSALLIAAGLGKKIALLDTENKSASLYEGCPGIPAFDTEHMGPPYHTSKYLLAIRDAVAAKYDVLIIDSISHQWSGEGGILDRKDKEQIAKPTANGYTLWAKYTPEHEQFLSAIQQADIHVIATCRSKQDYVLQQDERGKQKPMKVGLAPIQRDAVEYQFSTVFDISMEHVAAVSKDRTGLFDGQHFKPSADTGKMIADWLAGAAPEELATFDSAPGGAAPLPKPTSSSTPGSTLPAAQSSAPTAAPQAPLPAEPAPEPRPNSPEDTGFKPAPRDPAQKTLTATDLDGFKAHCKEHSWDLNVAMTFIWKRFGVEKFSELHAKERDELHKIVAGLRPEVAIKRAHLHQVFDEAPAQGVAG